MRAIVSNADYFKANILKFKTFIYDRNSKTKYIYIFCMRGGNTPPRKGEAPSSGMKVFNSGNFRIKGLKIRKTNE